MERWRYNRYHGAVGASSDEIAPRERGRRERRVSGRSSGEGDELGLFVGVVGDFDLRAVVAALA